MIWYEEILYFISLALHKKIKHLSTISTNGINLNIQNKRCFFRKKKRHWNKGNLLSTFLQIIQVYFYNPYAYNSRLVSLKKLVSFTAKSCNKISNSFW